MFQEEFIQLVEIELRLHGVGFDRTALAEFVDAAWPLIADDPDVNRWARAFVDSGNATLPA
jgi:hypothetical protein